MKEIKKYFDSFFKEVKEHFKTDKEPVTDVLQ